MRPSHFGVSSGLPDGTMTSGFGGGPAPRYLGGGRTLGQLREADSMKFDLCFAKEEIRVTLTESLRLPEGQSPRLGSPDGPAATDLLPQIESLVRKFLSGYVVNHDATQQSGRPLDAKICG